MCICTWLCVHVRLVKRSTCRSSAPIPYVYVHGWCVRQGLGKRSATTIPLPLIN